MAQFPQRPGYITIPLSAPRAAAAPAAPAGVQDRLTAAEFLERCEGFDEVQAEDMADARGGRVRYALEQLAPSGAVVGVKYRLGGQLSFVDPELRYLRLFNPYARRSWSVQLQPTHEQRCRLWYAPPPGGDEVVAMRRLLQQLERGEIEIRRLK